MTFWQFAFKNVTRNARAYFAYFVSSAFSIAIFFSFAVYLFHPKLHMTDVNYSLNILMTISEVVIVFFSFFFYCIQSGPFKSTKKQFGILTVLGISQKQLKRLIFIENMLIGALSIFLAFNLELSFHSSFISYRQNYTRTWFIFISAYKCYRFNYHHLSWALHSRIIFYTDAHSYEKSRTSFKEGTQQKKEKHPCSSLFGATCLICGYALAANPLYFMSLGDIIGLLYAVSSIFVIPSLIAAGTYFFFSQISFYLFVF